MDGHGAVMFPDDGGRERLHRIMMFNGHAVFRFQLDGGKDRWLFNFDEHSGKVHELAEWDTSCFPHPTFVGHSQFVAFGCRGSADKQDIAGFNMKGEQMWQQNFFDAHVGPMFAFAPAAGRFALGRTIVSTPLEPDALLVASVVTSQEVRVYQTYDGKQIFKIECSPVERAGQNFAGSSSCRGCHPDFYQRWSTSHHGLAMQPFTAELARQITWKSNHPVYAAGFQGGQGWNARGWGWAARPKAGAPSPCWVGWSSFLPAA